MKVCDKGSSPGDRNDPGINMASLTFADSAAGDIVVEESDNLNETVIVDTADEIEGEDKEVVNSDNNLETAAPAMAKV